MALIARVRATTDGWSGGPGLSTYFFGLGSEASFTGTVVQDLTGRVRALFDAVKSLRVAAITVQVDGFADILAEDDGDLVNQVNATSAPSVVLGTAVGTSTGPAFVTLVGKMRTNTFINGRRVAGRTYLSPLAASFTDSVAPEGGARAALQTGLDALLTGATSAVPVVWHRPVLGAGGVIVTPGSAVPVSSFSTSAEFGSLRSRR